MAYKNVYRIWYEIIPKMYPDGSRFPELHARYFRRGRAIAYNNPRYDGERDHSVHNSRYIVEADPLPHAPWYEVPVQPLDEFAKKMYPEMYTDTPLEKMNFNVRAENLLTVIRKYFLNKTSDYVKAIVRDFILRQYALERGRQKCEQLSATKWYTKSPVTYDIVMRFTDNTVSNARRGIVEYKRTFVTEGAFDPETEKMIDEHFIDNVKSTKFAYDYREEDEAIEEAMSDDDDFIDDGDEEEYMEAEDE